jgi:hypothetical protein
MLVVRSVKDMFLFIVVTDLLYTIKKGKKYTEFSAADCDLPQS